ncbi:TRAP transporter small permease subunit [Chelativorans sp. SCAU2101]|uniref:TRAP transporter small permease protein n=1 Tax=Chelativorans petroleitrophicus TaxID=2975484 RepID=A0A9X2X615_9HYPH|nr:TRAP transporter small permease subunit [Chelativorans petroleitrophicus]MCT8989218.1 TRAP transporter small permease subunit [Chelativorans petroleitrophicus]
MNALFMFLRKSEAVLAGTLLLLMVILIFLNGVARMMGHPLNWTIDLATCFFAWGCFLCADIAWRQDGLMSIEILTRRLPPKAARALDYINHMIIAGFLVYVIYAGVWLSWVSRARAFQGMPGVSYSWVTASIVVGGVLLLITTLIRLCSALREDGFVRAPRRKGEASC